MSEFKILLQRPTLHIIGHFGDVSLQGAGADNQTNTQKHKITKPVRNKLTLVKKTHKKKLKSLTGSKPLIHL